METKETKFVFVLIVRSQDEDDDGDDGFSSVSELDDDDDGNVGDEEEEDSDNGSRSSRNSHLSLDSSEQYSNGSLAGKCVEVDVCFDLVSLQKTNSQLIIDSPIKLTKRWRKNHEEDQMAKAEVGVNINKVMPLNVSPKMTSTDNNMATTGVLIVPGNVFPPRPTLLDISMSVSSSALYDSSCSSTSTSPSTNIVNWLNQTSMAGGVDYNMTGMTNVAVREHHHHHLHHHHHQSLSPTSSMASSSVSSGLSITSSDDDDPCNYLYLLASAAVDRMDKELRRASSSPSMAAAASALSTAGGLSLGTMAT